MASIFFRCLSLCSLLLSAAARSPGTAVIGTEGTAEVEPSLRRDQDDDDPSSLFDRCSHPASDSSLTAASHNATMAPCAYFRPTLFFQPSHPGHPYRSLLSAPYDTDGTTKLQAWALQVNNWPPSSPTSGPPLVPSPLRRHKVEIVSVTALTAPKIGSRTLHALYLSHLTRKGSIVDSNGNGVSRVGSASSAVFMEELSRRQSQRRRTETTARSDVVFAVFRDPVSRFTSAVYQLIQMHGKKRCRGCQVMEACLARYFLGGPELSAPEAEEGRAVLRCYIDLVQEHGFFNEHLLPFAYYIAKPLQGFDVEVAMFPIEHMGAALAEFGVEEGMHLNRKETTFVQDPLKGLVSAISKVQKEGSVGEDMKNEICELYAVDVAIINHLGFPVKHCNSVFGSSEQ